jgi:hypothetical protein
MVTPQVYGLFVINAFNDVVLAGYITGFTGHAFIPECLPI